MIFHMIDAVRYLHNFGIVHNDLKPDNILISNGGLLKISDMGLARKFDLENHTFTFTSERPIAQGFELFFSLFFSSSSFFIFSGKKK